MIRKIAVVGNSSGGKTVLARKLAQIHSLPLTHVDSIQFLPGLKIRPHKESIEILSAVQGQEAWIIDGYGPLDIIEKRFELADVVVFIDLPIYQHYWWLIKRQIQNLWSRRSELPEGCNERSLAHTIKLFQNIERAHRLMRPELLRIFAREKNKAKVWHLKNLAQWRQVFKTGLF